jgi:uncharacterized glyoxalase superfamily protein PhnB
VPDAAGSGRSRWAIAPYFLVGDVVATANYYRDMLGFHYERFWGDPAQCCMVMRRGSVIMLSQATADAIRPNHAAETGSEAWDAYGWIDDADALHAEFRSRGVAIARDLCDQMYGCRDFEFEDCNGYRLCFGHDTAGSS